MPARGRHYIYRGYVQLLTSAAAFQFSAEPDTAPLAASDGAWGWGWANAKAWGRAATGTASATFRVGAGTRLGLGWARCCLGTLSHPTMESHSDSESSSPGG